MQQIRQAVILARHEQGHSRRDLRVFDAPVHLQARGQRTEFRWELVRCQVKVFQRPLHTHQEHAVILVLVLIGMRNIATVLEEEVGNGRNQSFPFGATQ